MTTLQITLPDSLAQEAEIAGLLIPEVLEQLLRNQLTALRIDRLGLTRKRLFDEPLDPMTPTEIEAEIKAWRGDQRHASGT
jgi:hypothetical protein